MSQRGSSVAPAASQSPADPVGPSQPKKSLRECSAPECDLTLTGDVDGVTCDEVANLLISAVDRSEGDTVFVDVSGVTFLDSRGLSALVTARNHAAALEKRITLIGVRSRVRTVLNITGLSQIFLA